MRTGPSLTCGVRLTVVLAAVLHLDGRQAQGLDHLVRSFAPVRGAERQHGQREGQRGEEQGQQGAVTSGHFLQHGCFPRSREPGGKQVGTSQAWLRGGVGKASKAASPTGQSEGGSERPGGGSGVWLW